MITFIVIYIRPFSCYFSAVVDLKGPSAFVVQLVSEWILQCGLVKFLYRSDREKALKLLIETAVNESGREGKYLRLPGEAPDPTIDADEQDQE